MGRKGGRGGREYGAEGSMGRKGGWGGSLRPGEHASGAEGSMGRKGVWGARHTPTHRPPLCHSSYDISQPAGRHLPYDGGKFTPLNSTRPEGAGGYPGFPCFGQPSTASPLSAVEVLCRTRWLRYVRSDGLRMTLKAMRAKLRRTCTNARIEGASRHRRSRRTAGTRWRSIGAACGRIRPMAHWRASSRTHR